MRNQTKGWLTDCNAAAPPSIAEMSPQYQMCDCKAVDCWPSFIFGQSAVELSSCYSLADVPAVIIFTETFIKWTVCAGWTCVRASMSSRSLRDETLFVMRGSVFRCVYLLDCHMSTTTETTFTQLQTPQSNTSTDQCLHERDSVHERISLWMEREDLGGNTLPCFWPKWWWSG